MSLKSCEKVEKSQVVLTIEVGSAEFEAAIEKAYQKMRKKINVPGFRPGKAPAKSSRACTAQRCFSRRPSILRSLMPMRPL